MNPKYLMDTNLLVYSLDARQPLKQQQANDVLQHLGSFDNTVLALQTLSEFSQVALRKLSLSPEVVRRQVEHFMSNFAVLPASPTMVLEALKGVQDHQLAYYDAQLWAIAKLYGVPFILSEDFNSGATVAGVSFLNPLTPGFSVTTL